MKVAACQSVASLKSAARLAQTPTFFGPRILSLLALLSLLLICGCSSFNRDWKTAGKEPAVASSPAGRWDGYWVSDRNGHKGKLRCLLTHQEGDVYNARFRATYWKIMRFSYTVPLTFHPHDSGWEFNGEANLGKLAGGMYFYEGRATQTNLSSTYRSKYDNGRFELTRPE